MAGFFCALVLRFKVYVLRKTLGVKRNTIFIPYPWHPYKPAQKSYDNLPPCHGKS
jgi:hypothetical protein